MQSNNPVFRNSDEFNGRATNAYGNLVDFKNTLIIMTSNIGTKHLVNRTRVGFGATKTLACRAALAFAARHTGLRL